MDAPLAALIVSLVAGVEIVREALARDPGSELATVLELLE
jgi:hypothetical protein